MWNKCSKPVKVLLCIVIVCLMFTGFANLFATMKYLNLHGSLLPPRKEAATETVPAGPDAGVKSSPPKASDGRLLPKESGTSSEAPALQAPAAPVKGVSIAGFKALTIPAGTTEVPVDFYNPSSNEGEFIMTFELLFPMPDGTKLSLYSSGTVDAGMHIRNISLSHPVPQGTYENCILRIQPYFVSDGSPANSADVKFTLTAA